MDEEQDNSEPRSDIFVYITLIIFFFLSVILILLVVFGVIRSPPTQSEIADNYTSILKLQLGFGDSFPYSEPIPDTSYNRSDCLVYNTFTTRADTVDTLLPIGYAANNNFICNDGYTLALSKQYETCEQSFCIGQDGNEYTKGERRIFYANCDTLDTCKNFRSVVAFNYYLVENVIGPSSYCLDADNTASNPNFGLISCSEAAENPTLTNDIFVTVESAPAYLGSDFLVSRLRIPNQDRCLFFEVAGSDQIPTGKIYTSSCSQSKNSGYSWLYHDKISIGSKVYPSGFITYYGNLTEEEFQNLEQLLENSGALSGTNGVLSVIPQQSCSENICNGTQIIPITSWNSVS